MQKIFLVLFVGILAVFLGYKAMKSSTVMDDVVLKNMEALADGENGLPVICAFSGSYICPSNGKNVGVVYEGYSLRP